ncbi:MAG TPA: ATP synthase F0 subunit B [Planctomycetota bacterium]|nr:ATP synthase F0 subunit B [Planctomycetota bacterium]
MLMAEAGPGQIFIVQCLGFAVLVFVLVKLAFPALGKVLGARVQGIEETFKKIDQDTQETSKRLAEMKDKVAHLTEESKRRLDAALADAQQTKAQIMTESTAQVQAAFEKAKVEIQIERDKAILELRQEATTLTMQAAEYLVQSTMNDALNEKLLEKYLTQLDSVKRP